MSLPVILREEAEQDILEGAQWYENREVRLGSTFIQAVDDCLLHVSRAPEFAPVVYRNARMALPNRFPYLVIYKVFDDYVSVVAVIKGSRHPNRWKARVRK